MSPELVIELFNKHAKELTFFANGLLGSSIAEEGCDVVQDVFIKISKFEYDGVKSWRLFLINLVQKECFNVLKSRKSRNKEVPPWFEENVPIDEYADSKIVKSELIVWLYEKRKELPESRQRIFDKVFLEQKSVSEVASEMGIKPSTVLVQVMRIRESFKVFQETRWQHQKCGDYTNIFLKGSDKDPNVRQGKSKKRYS